MFRKQRPRAVVVEPNYYIARFDYPRPPHRINANCLIVIPKDGVGKPEQYVFFQVEPQDKMSAKVRRFHLDAIGPEEKQTVIQNVQHLLYLAFLDGETLAEVDNKDINEIANIVENTMPLWDEYAIIKRVHEEPAMKQLLLRPNTFGTWADVMESTMTEICGPSLMWLEVGGGAAMPTKNKLLEFTF